MQSWPMIGCDLDHLQKFWPTEFSDDRIPPEEQAQVDYTLEASSITPNLPSAEVPLPLQSTSNTDLPGQSSNDEPDRLQLFLQSYDNDDPTIVEEEITEFCAGVHLSVLKQPHRDEQTAAWLDDRLYSFYGQPSSSQASLPDLRASTMEAQATAVARDFQFPERGPKDTTHEDGCRCSTARTASTALPYRKYDPPLTASELHKHLKEKV